MPFILGCEKPILKLIYQSTDVNINKTIKWINAVLFKIVFTIYYVPNIICCVYGYFCNENFSNDSFYQVLLMS